MSGLHGRLEGIHHGLIRARSKADRDRILMMDSLQFLLKGIVRGGIDRAAVRILGGSISRQDRASGCNPSNGKGNESSFDHERIQLISVSAIVPNPNESGQP